MDMSNEIFAQICSYLEPLWLWNLSHACRKTYELLSFEDGNRIWYDAVPPSLWIAEEHFQDEDELHNFKAQSSALESGTNSPIHFGSTVHGLEMTGLGGVGLGIMLPEFPGYVYPYVKASSAVCVKLRSFSFEIEAGPTIPGEVSWLTSLWHTTDSLTSLGSSQLPGTSPPYVAGSPYLLTDPVAPETPLVAPRLSEALLSRYGRYQSFRFSPVPFRVTFDRPAEDRTRVLTLGGLYQPFFNYKRELIGRWCSGQRCYVCLAKKSDMFSHHRKLWGIVWCEMCLKAYTICKSLLASLTFASSPSLLSKENHLRIFEQ